MSTSLATQLQQLAVKANAGTRPDDISQGRASLLFSAQDATGINKETIHQIAMTGLKELSEIDKRFQDFETTLFSVDSKKLERTVISSDVNTQIDSFIGEFMVLVAPHVMRNGAIKALEWLIQRFGIHKFNFNNFIYAFVPFHEMKIFTRVLQ
ncbi:HEAT repeat-containing protein 1-like, partial [Convolutriloba macropyga]|uniref:HEAT repeat-containing protein 1-like n=1 Tax=Convolutriloba macropyga TaxID=536237 RepID=UPI003F521508